jgi:DNA repair photolyase
MSNNQNITMETKIKKFNGKAIYNPSGKSREYSYWACNFYVNCSGGCTYCYLKKGIGKKVLGGDKPTLKKCFKDEQHAKDTFVKEVRQNIDELRKHGLFFCFTTDPMLPETIELTKFAVDFCVLNHVPVKILTKQVGWVTEQEEWLKLFKGVEKEVAIGFTLTGHCEMELGCSPNSLRILAMKKLYKKGFKIFASIEPIIDLKSSWKMIEKSLGFCHLFKVGLESGKTYKQSDLKWFIIEVMTACICTNAKVYFKDSILKQADMDRDELCSLNNSVVKREYNIFEKK